VYHVLTEQGCQVILANARHIKAVPGRKTDTKDCEWIADLLRHGLLRGSFIPDQAQRELRDLTRTRTTLTDERSAVVQRLQQVLEDANVKLAGVGRPISWARLAVPSWRPFWRGPLIQPRWLSWPRDGCAASRPNWSRPSAGGCASITAG
jgi:hypothetical protein